MKSSKSYHPNKSVTPRALLVAHFKKSAAWLMVIATTLALAWPAPAGQPFGPGGKRGVETMTVNLYIGGGTDRILALDPNDPTYLNNLIATVTGIYYEILTSQPAVRLDGVASQIAAQMPDIVAVQEASLIRNQSPGDLVVGGTNPATNVVADYLEILVDLLNARGAHYAVASTGAEIDIELPMFNLQSGNYDDVRLTDREAILVRTDLPRGQLRVTHPQSGNFTNVIQIPSLGLSVLRGWCSVDVFIRGEVFRYICAHLEQETVPQLQVAQAKELLGGPAKVCLPVMLCGDFNADALHRDGSVAYDNFIRAGFRDAWAETHRRNLTGGLTWGHDELLADPTLKFDRRIDFVFYKGGSFLPERSDVVDLWLGRSTLPLWSTDHAAVTAEFLLR